MEQALNKPLGFKRQPKKPHRFVPPEECEVNDLESNPESSSHGTNSSSGPTTDEAIESKPQLLAKTASSRADQQLVRGARVTVMLVLFLSAVTVASLAYVLLSRSQEDNFKGQFKSAARQVILMANRNAANVFVSFHTMAAIFPSYAKKSGDRLPFVTIDDYETIAAGFRTVSKASLIHYAALLRSEDDLHLWNNYSVTNAHQWIDEGRRNYVYGADEVVSDQFSPVVFTFSKETGMRPMNGSGPFLPTWMMSPVPANLGMLNVDGYSFEFTKSTMDFGIKTGRPTLSKPAPGLRNNFAIDVDGPLSFLYQPVFDDLMDVPTKKVIGFLTGTLAWKYFFDNTLPDGQNNVLVVVESCETRNTFEINGPVATFVAEGDHHDHRYNHLMETASFVQVSDEDVSNENLCHHTVKIYPTAQLEEEYRTYAPLAYAVVILAIFTFAALVFLLYDYFVTSRQNRTERQADQSNAIVQEMFPGQIAQQLFGNQDDEDGVEGNGRAAASSLKRNVFGKVDRKTIAELHPEATVLFADISGFTAWSSTRDPHQVFTLLESIFQAFDGIAKRHRIFKVETIGDCYVAACGVPVANDEHAIVMCRFARRIMVKFRWVCRNLELTLGPDTGDLSLRVGMHSGPVTAGVLRGERARFQLFGDTVNTASRIESTGKRDRIHLSEQTAAQLAKHGKDEWFVLRDDAIEAKGKGKLITYWLKLAGHRGANGSVVSASEVDDIDNADVTTHCADKEEQKEWKVEMPALKSNEAESRSERLAHWNSELLLELLQRVVAHRAALQADGSLSTPGSAGSFKLASPNRLTDMARAIGNGNTVVEEVVEIIDMPEFVGASSSDDLELPASVVKQLRSFVGEIAAMYNDNPFHNFEHASHVTMSVHKLLGRIVAPKIDLGACSDADQQAAVLHDHTCGITSDPLTQFAVVLSALIHDLDHPGVSNGQLIKEDPKLAVRYKEKSVAEQNSVDLAWNILMAPQYNQLRAAIFATETELYRFRHLLVNSIIATDIFDKDLGTLRKNRWNKAFYETTPDDDAQEVKSRKATIVIEHLIQASDVAHTMQHWHVYQKWNQRLFNEMMMAYRDGRSDKDPSEGWYGGELWFFDNYVIPLAKKLKDCGVFGVSSDEYLNYAQHNRDEWETKGKDVVAQYREEFESKFEQCLLEC